VTASISLRTPNRTSRTVSCVAAAPSIGVESTICSTGPSNSPNSRASVSVFSNANPSFLCSNNRARNFVNDVGCHP
jgi:hypothetical protein